MDTETQLQLIANYEGITGTSQPSNSLQSRQSSSTDVEGFLSKYCNIQEAIALSFILLDVHSIHRIKKLNNMFQSEHKQLKELKHMLDIERKGTVTYSEA